MKLVKLFQVPQGTQVVLQDLGQMGTRKTADNLDSKIMVEIELEGTPGGGKKRITYAHGSQNVFVDENAALLTT